MKITRRTCTAVALLAALCILLPAAALAVPGDIVKKITVPVPSSSCCGIGIAVDCDGILYYTNTSDPTLFKTDKNGAPLGSIPLVEDASGAPISFGAISWDNTRMVIWGGTDSRFPAEGWTIDPATGRCHYVFTTHSYSFIDGIAFDGSDNTVWISNDASCPIDHFDATTGGFLGTLTPTDGAGNQLCRISGVVVGTGNKLYLGRNGLGKITRVNKTTGVFISEFATVGGRDEDLECDVINFAPLTVLWSKDAYDNTVTAIEVEPGTCACGGAPQPGGCRTYTLDADFDQGLMINVNHDAPNHDQLQLNQNTTPFPFVNIACSQRGTAVRIDVNTGQILGEFFTAPDGMGRDPSRTTVDQMGNVWLTNRAEAGGGQGSVTRIGLVIGGTRCDAGGTPDPLGQYLKPPFTYTTCTDRDGDGLIKTSRGLGNILPWTNAGGADANGGVSTAEDECIINYTRVTGTNARTVAVDANNDVWVGGLGDLDHEKISGVTGQPVPNTQFNLGCGGYGGLVDGNGVLWSARGGGGLLRFVPNGAPPPAGAGVCLDGSHGDYGLGIDPNTGHIWHTFLTGGNVAELDAAGNVLNVYPHGEYYAQGVAVDDNHNVWVAHSLFGSTTVGHLLTNGTFVGNVPLPGGNGPTGVAVDANGKIWVANINTSNAMRIDPNAGPIGGGGVPVGAVDMTVDLGAGAGPYNYSDMTGFVAIGSTAPQGTWTVAYDGGAPGTTWGTVCWNKGQCAQPAGTGISVRARSSNDQVNWSAYVDVTNCVDITVPDGRYLQVEVKLTPNANGESPILCDVTICTGPSTVPPLVICPGDMEVQCVSEIPPPDVTQVICTALTPTVVTWVGDSPLEGGPCGGTIQRTYRCTDAAGLFSDCVQTFFVNDTTPPSFECPQGLKVECLADVPPCSPPGGLTALDNCDGPVPVKCFRSDNGGQGCLDNPLIITDTYIAFDKCNNEFKCLRQIVVIDDKAPTIECPPDLRFACLGDVPPNCAVDGLVAKDNCDGPVPVNCTRTDNGGTGCANSPLVITDTYFATDHCGNTGRCTRTITVIDDVPPTITCPLDFTVIGLENLPPCSETSVIARDNCGGPVSIKCSRNSFGGIGCGNGPVFAKYTYTATDGCGNSVSCVQKVTVILPPCNFIVALAGPTGTIQAPVGTQVSIPVAIDSAQYEIGRIELAFTYNPAAVSILNVTKGGALSEWEFFTYRISSDGASNVVRLTAIADQGTDGHHPSEYAFRPDGPVAYLNFLVTSDRRFVDTDVPVARYQSACSDNAFTSRAEDVSFVSKDADAGNCGSGLKGEVQRAIVFNPGRIRIVAPTLQLGDINLNNVAYEVGDAVLLVNYFVSGNAVLSADADLRALQISASDVNHDGTPLSVADLVYLTRVIIGDASPLAPGAKLSPYAGSASAAIRAENGSVHLTTSSSSEVGAALFVLRCSGMAPGTPVLSAAASDLSMKSRAQNGEMRILVYGWENGARINSGAGEVLTIPTTGSGSIELVDVQMSDASGALLSASAAKSAVPGDYALLQNYPNPFNAATVIHYRLADAGHVQLAVYNVLGQSIMALVNESQGAGDYSVTWDGRDDAGNGVASGMYFYRLQVGEMVAIRKMTLLK